MAGYYQQPALAYRYSDLKPFLSPGLLKLHYDQHHQAYVQGANNLIKALVEARKREKPVDLKSKLKALSYHLGGHRLHSLFWGNIGPVGQSAGPKGRLKAVLEREFGSFKRFKEEFSQTTETVEGSGWAVLTYCAQTERPLLMQVEKHNLNLYPGVEILMVLDVWEHAYYYDYQNKRADYIDQFWSAVNWQTVAERLGKV